MSAPGSCGVKLSDFELAKLLQDEFDAEVKRAAAAASDKEGEIRADFLLAQRLQEELQGACGETVAGSSGGVHDVDEDYKLARQLQDEAEQGVGPVVVAAGAGGAGVDDELLDPTPDIRALFLQYNSQYFHSALSGIEVKWSGRMTLCAGLCYYKPSEHYCSVRLSAPLLKLRPRSDMVNTLLHEMIHAYLFVTRNNRDHDDHGPEFHKHMARINAAAGTDITVYHTFHDEVDYYRQHKWQCDGSCRSRPPYFGLVCRAMNRPPSARDPWFAQHQATCGGTYTKIQEPEGYGQKKGKKGKAESKPTSSNGTKLDDYFNAITSPVSGNTGSSAKLGGDCQQQGSSRGVPQHSRLLQQDGAVLTSSNRTNVSPVNSTTQRMEDSAPAKKRNKTSVNNPKWAKIAHDLFSSSDSE